MAFDAFLKIDPSANGITVKGESRDKTHSGEIEILNYSWGATNPVVIGGGHGAGAGKAKLKPFIITKKVDQASTFLFKACATGDHFPTATLTIRKAGGAQLEYLVLTFSTVFVTAFEPFGEPGSTSLLAPADPSKGGDALPNEQVTFVYGGLKISYQPQGSDGRAQGGPVVATWDQTTNSDQWSDRA